MYGSGWDTLLCHDNVDPRVHSWSSRELGYTPFSLIDQVAESCRYGHIVPASDELPATFYVGATTKPQDANYTLIVGGKNRMFKPKGQEQAYEFLRERGLRADLVRMPGYGHLDTFWGRDAADDVFPTILAGLTWNGDNATAPSQTMPPRPKP
jgi:hypothetical protein